MLRLLLIPILSIGLIVFLAAQPMAEDQSQPTVIKVYKSPGWGCCGGWIKHLEDNGLIVEAENTSRVSEIKGQYKIPVHLQSCHTAIVDGYVVEGHVPTEEVKRLLKEKPDIIGLSVPGMPVGSQGMEMPNGATEPYKVLSFDKFGNVKVFATYPKWHMSNIDCGVLLHFVMDRKISSG
jgi:hypothetical protein